MLSEVLIMDAQLKKGIIDICVLSSLMDGPSYGYKIIKDISDKIEILGR